MTKAKNKKAERPKYSKKKNNKENKMDGRAELKEPVKPKSNRECFINPLIKVDVKTGQVHVNRLWELWSCQNK